MSFVWLSSFVSLVFNGIIAPSGVFSCNSTVPFVIFVVLIFVVSDSVGPFPSLSFTLVFTVYSVSVVKSSNTGLVCQSDHSSESIFPFPFVSFAIAYSTVVSSIPEPLSAWLFWTVIVLVVAVPVGAVLSGVVVSSQIAYRVIVWLFVVVKFETDWFAA